MQYEKEQIMEEYGKLKLTRIQKQHSISLCNHKADDTTSIQALNAIVLRPLVQDIELPMKKGYIYIHIVYQGYARLEWTMTLYA